MTRSSRWWACGVAVILCATACAPSDRDPGEDARTYPTSTIRLVVPFGPGGTYDLHARVLAEHLGRHLPGDPSITVENMPGAGGLIAARYLGHLARPDGGTIGLLNAGTGLSPRPGNGRPDVELSQFAIVGSPHVDHPVCVFSRDSGIHDIASWRSAMTPPRVGMTGPGALSYAVPLITARALELPVTPVSGYAGMAEIRHAMDGGEVDGACLGLASFRRTFAPTTRYVVALQAGARAATGLEEVDVLEEVRDAALPELLELPAVIAAVSRIYALPPDTPPAVTDMVAVAFATTMQDPAFLDAANEAGLPGDWRSSDEVAASLEALLTLSEETRALVAEALDARG